ncbi:hypothetical protein JFK97_20670 [Chromobacterium phragmitis]|uniref:hypothetical protein n=1 Tax=Chromobacterium amazonense TaxID=1382803 RepID=UPI0021B800EE|nr:hypothetical protein [Chromobacterium amazonense]MBM2886805.1 hypothetical protein [Chromobacterium amazonense]MDE1715663.1 hypothetical protein [Chromobacterium amazonense]
MKVYRNGQSYGFVQDKKLIDMLALQLGAAASEFSCICGLEEAKVVCEEYILQTYPLWRQLNILREGSQDEKNKMSNFINACRSWSNGPSPDSFLLSTIKP